MIEEQRHVKLRAPVLITAFRGWNDAGDAASFAATHLCRAWGAQKIASIDPEEFFDFQASRPHVRLEDGVTREIVWPANEFFAAKLKSAPRDALLLVGTEPNIRWKTFARLVIDFARRHQVELMATMGALLADVPHSRAVPVTGTALDQDMIDRFNLTRSRYEGPTGIVGVLHSAFATAGVPSASLWAAVPHYLAISPNPKAALALVRKASQLIEVDADTSTLEKASLEYERRVSEIVASDEDIEAYVRTLEERTDEQMREEINPQTLPSGEELAVELERFLREGGHDG